MDTIIDELKQNLEAIILGKHQQMLREKYKQKSKEWREANVDKYREDNRLKQREYYQKNKAMLNNKRVESARKQRARERLEDECNPSIYQHWEDIRNILYIKKNVLLKIQMMNNSVAVLRRSSQLSFWKGKLCSKIKLDVFCLTSRFVKNWFWFLFSINKYIIYE